MALHERTVETKISSASRKCQVLFFSQASMISLISTGNTEGSGKQTFLFSSAWQVIKYLMNDIITLCTFHKQFAQNLDCFVRSLHWIFQRILLQECLHCVKVKLDGVQMRFDCYH